jgi:hypothetical protein
MSKTIDWERIEAEYRAGILSLREIAAKHEGSNHVAIARRAKKEEWTRDLSARIQAKAEALVTEQTVTADVTASKAVTAKQVVEENAQAIANVRLAHRKDISRSRTLAMLLLQELEQQTGNQDLLEGLRELMAPPDGEDSKANEAAYNKRMEMFDRVVSLAGRTDIMKKLSETLKNLIGLEREAYGLKTGDSDPGDSAPAGLDHFYGRG